MRPSASVGPGENVVPSNTSVVRAVAFDEPPTTSTRPSGCEAEPDDCRGAGSCDGVVCHRAVAEHSAASATSESELIVERERAQRERLRRRVHIGQRAKL